MYLLDTNIIIGILRDKQEIIKKYQKILNKNQSIFLKTYSLSEIYVGFFDQKFKKKSLKKYKIQEELFCRMIKKLNAQKRIVALEVDCAKKFGELLYLLKIKATPIPIIDTLIGAIAISKDLTVITTDQNHFKTLKTAQRKLKVEFW